MGKKKKGPTLAYQMRSAVNDNFSEGKSKRAAKLSDGSYGSAIYSYAHRKDLIEFSSQFANFCKETFGIKQVKDVNSEHAKAFIEEKSKSCADSTLKTYHQHLIKLNKCFKSSFKSFKDDLTSGWVIPRGNNVTKLREPKMSRESMDKVISKLDMTFGSHRAIALAEALGLRASETVKVKGSHIDLNKGVVTVQGKGGRFRDVPIREERKELLHQLKEEFGESRIAPVKPDSVNATLQRICRREEIADLEGSKSGIHAIRKLYATECYELKLAEGKSEQSAWADVSENLGHGRNRPDLHKIYVVK